MNDTVVHPTYAFDGFRLDVQHRFLSRAGGDPIPLAPKVFDTLLYFVEHAGELLDKRELLEAIWPHVIVEENSLNQTISALRRVLGERPGDHRFIATEPGRGYRFLATVREVPAVETGDKLDALAAAPSSKVHSVAASNTFDRRWALAVVASLAVASMLVVIGRYVLKGDAAQDVITNELVETSPAVVPTTPTNSIAVLPFVNLSSDPEQEPFSDGLSEELLSTLEQRTDLHVTASSSSFKFKGSNKSVQEIARALGVALVLEGSVRRVGNQLRIDARLINAADGYMLWSDTYARQLDDVFDIQAEIAAAIAGSLSARLDAHSGPSLGGTDVMEAYDLYVVSRGHMTLGNRDHNTLCREYLDRAIGLDPGFAAAWARKSLAHAHAHMLFDERSGGQHGADAVQAAQRAIQLEPNLGLAHLALGQAWAMGSRLPQAEEEYRQAIKLDQRMSEAAEYALLQLAVGNIEKALAGFQAARETDPLNPTITAFLVGSHHMLGDDAAALAEYERGREGLYPDHFFTSFMATVGRLGTHNVESPRDLPMQANALEEAVAKHFLEPQQALQELHKLYADERYNDRRRLAMWAAYFGDPDLALRALKEAADDTALNSFMLWFPLFSEARRQPGFKDVVRELGLVAYWRQYGWPQYCQPANGNDFECS